RHAFDTFAHASRVFTYCTPYSPVYVYISGACSYCTSYSPLCVCTSQARTRPDGMYGTTSRTPSRASRCATRVLPASSAREPRARVAHRSNLPFSLTQRKVRTTTTAMSRDPTGVTCLEHS
ncbi:hypothetical protein BE221DRAFT_59078, partial [Ostreococcus tauri]